VSDLPPLFAEQSSIWSGPVGSALSWLLQHWSLWIFGPVGVAGLWLTSFDRRDRRWLGFGLMVVSLGLGWAFHLNHSGLTIPNALFSVFGILALLSAAGMLVQRNPVYMALYFSLVVLNTCGIFLLQGAPFIAASTIIVYAGAIIVTFLFVIMLAQQHGNAVYDARMKQPVLAGTFAALLFLVAMQSIAPPGKVNAGAEISPAARLTIKGPTGPGPLTVSVPDPAKSVPGTRMLGRTMFTDYLLTVEMAGSILLVATIGAILIASRKRTAS
jgi:NADH-quinone oxidoreductase subunit J